MYVYLCLKKYLLSSFFSQNLFPHPATSLSAFKGLIVMPGRPGGDCPAAIVQELFTQIDKIQSPHYSMAPHHSTDTDNFNQF